MARKIKFYSPIERLDIDEVEIKASHPDVNVYMNTIVDEAIRHHYSFGFIKAS